MSMSELTDLYQEVILDHYRNPRNFRVMEDADHTAEGYNPLCGDRLRVYLKMDGDRIVDLSFTGAGCAISLASASVMTSILKGKTKTEFRELFRRFQSLVTAHGGEGDLEELGELAAMSGVSAFPARVKCATLAWHSVTAAMDQRKEPVTTE